MAKLKTSITINAPAKEIFGYVTEPTNLPDVWPGLVTVKDVEPLPTVGKRFRWVYKTAGVPLEGSSETVECVANQRNVSRTTGGIQSTVTWTFQPDAGGTKVTLGTEYTVPIPLVGKLAEAIIVKQNQHEAELLLASLKARLEAESNAIPKL